MPGIPNVTNPEHQLFIASVFECCVAKSERAKVRASSVLLFQESFLLIYESPGSVISTLLATCPMILSLCFIPHISISTIEYCRSVGEDKIWQQVKLISGILRNKLSAIERVKIVDRGAEKGSSVTFHVAHSTPEFIVHELLKQKINVVASYRAYGLIDFDEKGIQWVIRVSPHYYNTVSEIDTFIEALKEIIKTKKLC